MMLLVQRTAPTWPLDRAPRAARSKVFRKYLVNAEALPAVGTPLKPIFDRMREQCRAAEA